MIKNVILVSIGAFLTLAIQALHNAPNHADKTAAFQLCKTSDVFEHCTLSQLDNIAARIHEARQLSAQQRAELIEILSN